MASAKFAQVGFGRLADYARHGAWGGKISFTCDYRTVDLEPTIPKAATYILPTTKAKNVTLLYRRQGSTACTRTTHIFNSWRPFIHRL